MSTPCERPSSATEIPPKVWVRWSGGRCGVVGSDALPNVDAPLRVPSAALGVEAPVRVCDPYFGGGGYLGETDGSTHGERGRGGASTKGAGGGTNEFIMLKRGVCTK